MTTIDKKIVSGTFPYTICLEYKSHFLSINLFDM